MDFKQPIVVTASTLTVNKHTHGGGTIIQNAAAGSTITLPASDGSGAIYKVFVKTTVTANLVIKVANSTDVLRGVVALSTDINGSVMLTSPTDDTITLNGSTTGGLTGSWIEVEDVATGFWKLQGWLVCTGTEGTPFSATV